MAQTLIRQSSFNYNQMSGAMQQVLQIFGALPPEAVNQFACKFAAFHPEIYTLNTVSKDYAEQVILRDLLRKQRAFRLRNGCFSLHPFVRFDPKKVWAFWIYLEFIDEIVRGSICTGPFPAQVSFLRRNAMYHIISCEEAGATELSLAVTKEQARMEQEQIYFQKHQSTMKGTPAKIALEHRYILAFESLAMAMQANVVLKEPTLICVVAFDNGMMHAPHLTFYDSASIQEAQKNNE